MDDVLGVKSGGLPRGSLVLITDEVGASGGWLVAHLLRRALADADSVSATERLAHWLLNWLKR